MNHRRQGREVWYGDRSQILVKIVCKWRVMTTMLNFEYVSDLTYPGSPTTYLNKFQTKNRTSIIIIIIIIIRKRKRS